MEVINTKFYEIDMPFGFMQLPTYEYSDLHFMWLKREFGSYYWTLLLPFPPLISEYGSVIAPAKHLMTDQLSYAVVREATPTELAESVVHFKDIEEKGQRFPRWGPT